MLHQERRQETIFTEGEVILLMQRANVGLSILFDNSVTLVSCSDTIKTETSGKTSDRTNLTGAI